MTTGILAADPFSYSWWIASRAAGIVAIVLVSASVCLGLTMATRARRRPGMSVVLRKLHQYVAVTALVAIVAHGLFLLADPWLHPGVKGVLVPFSMSYRPVWTGLGIIAGWSAMVLGLSYWLRKRIGPDRWKTIHRFTLLAWFMALIHVIGAGTDGKSTWLLLVLLIAVAPVPALLVLRLWPAKDARPTAPRAAPVAAPVSGMAARPVQRRRAQPPAPLFPTAPVHPSEAPPTAAYPVDDLRSGSRPYAPAGPYER